MDDAQARRDVARPGRGPGAGRAPHGVLPRPLSVVSVPRAVSAFLLAGLLAVAAVAVVLAYAQQRSATQAAVQAAQALTRTHAEAVLRPVLTRAALVPGPAQDVLDRVVRERVVGDSIVRVKIWDEDGHIAYSDEPELIGHRFALGEQERTALRTGGSVAEVSDLDEAEHLDEARYGRLLQVYLGVRTTDGQPLLLETYQPYETIERASRRSWLASLPVLLGGLGLLYLLQAPLAYAMATRLRATQDERERLLVSSLATSDQERAQIAAELHDGAVQGLDGAGHALCRVADEVRAAGLPHLAETVQSTAVDLRRWVRELRGLITSVAPPALDQRGLEPALVDLLRALEVHGTSVDLSVDGAPELDEADQVLTYRVVREALRHVVRHAQASHVSVHVGVEAGVLEVTVTDDGRGVDAAGPDPAREEVGMELLAALAADRDGRLDVLPRPGGGTVVRLVVPARYDADQDRAGGRWAVAQR